MKLVYFHSKVNTGRIYKMNSIRIYKVLVVVLFLGIASICFAVEGTWTRKADMPTARFCLSTSVVDGKIYAIGGGQTMSATHLSTVEAYDPAMDTWTRRADMPTSRHGQSSSVVNGKIYVIGGRGQGQAFLSAVEEYDPTTNTWTRKADMPTKRAYLCTCVVDGKIYAIGGRAAEDPPDPGPSAFEVYSPVTDTWIKKPDMPIQRAMAAACVVDGRIFVIGGVIESSHETPLHTVNEYDLATDTWTRKADMPTARMWHAASVVGSRIYVLGGEAFGGPVFSAVEEYDPSVDIWKPKPDMLAGRGMLSICTVNSKIYALGGTSQWYPPTVVATVEEYDLTPPPPDFNGDGMVDIKDLLRLIGSWNQDDSLLDIAPPPFGDGIVDASDLELLMISWQQPVDDPTLLAHWALDETESIIAYDTAGVNDAVVVGGTEWQPNSGQIDGALQLNGVDGCAISNPVMNPADDPFSVFAWIKGGAPGQVVISQQNGSNWLGTDPELGSLTTELCESSRNAGPLISEIVITNDTWHRIGFVWDGANRALYVDDILVAEDTQANLQGSDGSLYIGTSKAAELGTYFSGLIDDVRIYNRAVRP
jgi:N-acetylneuraminic acid mutarotase